jgi:hypothetical protein
VNQKHLFWIIPVTLVIGIIIGFNIAIPSKLNITVDAGENIRNISNTFNQFYRNLTNICCYPSNCPMAVNNPKYCTCTYMVYCYEGDENGTPLKRNETLLTLYDKLFERRIQEVQNSTS